MPYTIQACRKNTSLLGIANAFSGGIFIAISLLHILPEVSEDYRRHNMAHQHTDESGFDKIETYNGNEPVPVTIEIPESWDMHDDHGH